MSSTKPPNENAPPTGRQPGLKSVQTTLLFRAVNPELFIRPNKAVMAFGLVAVSLCVAYLGYLHATAENHKDLSEAIDPEGSRHIRKKTSKWD
ncbi:PREDICTED: small integral membrane protein 8 [Acanthisitta chloris]|uniref:small integral membrane protein 8 n=1 Tax=Acanthisitta chloris TaxID=57068 RepID=UPI0004F0D970|nr:PREDICTED: small integral membrane protein 8 [Acanthisitta chloris]